VGPKISKEIPDDTGNYGDLGNFDIYLNANKKSVDLRNILIIVVRNVLGIITLFLMYYMQKSASDLNLNGAVIVSILVWTPVITTFAFYYLFGEKVHLRDFFGIFILILSVVLIAIGA